MDDAPRILRCDLDGRWTAAQMADSFHVLDELYNLRAVLELMREDSEDWEKLFFELMHFPPWRGRLRRRLKDPRALFLMPGPDVRIPIDPVHLRRVVTIALPNRELQIVRVELSSPGVKDLLGAGEVIGHLKDLTWRVIEHWSSRDRRRLENEQIQLRNDQIREEIRERKLQNEAIRIDNARNFVQLAEDLGYSRTEARELVGWVDQRQETLISSAESGRLTGVRMLDRSERE